MRLAFQRDSPHRFSCAVFICYNYLSLLRQITLLRLGPTATDGQGGRLGIRDALMPIHDWSRVFPGTFHHFHTSWVTHLAEALNGCLPAEYYALSEQQSGDVTPEVVTLTRRDPQSASAGNSGALLSVDTPPNVSIRMIADERATYRGLRRTVMIRHRSQARVVAMIEIISPGNKDSERSFNYFIEKSVSALRQGVHLLIADIFLPTSRDPDGIHGALWGLIGGTFHLPADRPLTFASYLANKIPEAFVEPAAVGTDLPEMPVFLNADEYVNAPLGTSYEQAYRRLPAFVKEILAGTAPSEWESI